jgi:hypothetical protein
MFNQIQIRIAALLLHAWSQYNLLFLCKKLKKEQLVVSVGRDSIKAAVDPSNNDDSVRNPGRTAHTHFGLKLSSMEM